MKTTDPLDAVQRWFQSVVTNPAGVEEGIVSEIAQKIAGHVKAEDIIKPSSRLTSIERLAIYANAYYARLIDCMGAYFPVLKRTLGDEVFNSFVLEYLQQYPSRSYTLDHLGDHFCRFLAETRPQDEDESDSGDWPDFLIDLATLEWTIARIFDDEGNEGKQMLTPEILRAIPAERFGEARLQPALSLHLLVFHFPVSTYYSAAKKAAEQDTIPVPDAATERIAILRRDYIVRRYHLTEPQWILLRKILDGADIHDAISAAAEVMNMDDNSIAAALQSWFRDWSSAGFFSGIELESR
jgi:hypothetical protein